MAHLTYTFKLFQTKGRKGKALHLAMRRWTQAHTEFLDLCRERVSEFAEACTRELPSGRTSRSKLSLQKWIRQQIKTLPSYAALESSMKDSLIALLGGQLMSFLELREMQDSTGFPTGRGHSDLDFEQYLDELVLTDWTLAPEQDADEAELQYVTLQGKVQGYRPKALYSPIEFCRYDTRRNYFLARSDDGQYFAGLYLTTEDTGFRLNGVPLTVLGKQEVLKSLSKKAVLVPLATGTWVVRKLERYRPETARLVYRDGEFYLHVALEVPDAEPKPYETILGIDRGKNRLASISVLSLDGRHVLHSESFSGFGLHKKRVNDITAKVKKAQGKGAHYFYKYGDINKEAANTIANNVLLIAKKYRSKLVFEDLDNMMRSMMAGSARKTNFNKGRKSNIYAELLRVLEYKTAVRGIQSDKVSAAYTSQTCPECGHVDRYNRLTRKGRGLSRLYFKCTHCGYANDDADTVAAVNIARRSLYKAVCKERRGSNADKISWQDYARSFCSG